MPGRTLSPRELNRALLARQHLLEPSTARLPETLQRIGGIQAQYAPSMYIGLWSRMADLRRDALTRALERAAVVQGTLLRSTIHLVAAADYWPFALAVRAGRREWWLRTHADTTSSQMAGAARRLRRALADGPLRQQDIDGLLGQPRSRGAGLWVDLLRAPPSGTWEQRRANLFVTAESRLGPPPALARAQLLGHLVRRYLGGFGPATAQDIAGWAGIRHGELAATLRGMELHRYRDTDGRPLYDLPGAPLPDANTPAPALFLPTFDATLLVHARRTGILPEVHRPRVFSTKTPQSTPTFLIDGAVAGAWRYRDGHIELQPYGRLDAGARRALDERAERLAAFHA